MQTIKLTQKNQSEILSRCVETIRRGGSVAYPTDTVYGLGVNPFDDFMVRRLFRIKKRPPGKAVPLIVKSIAMAKKLAFIGDSTEKILKAVWPGSVSVILKKRDIIPDWLTAGKNSVSLRMPDNDLCVKSVKAFNGPITSTSCNISGEEPMLDPQKIYERFKNEAFKPDLIIDGGVLKPKQPSTILDLTQGKPKIVRVGPVSPKELGRILEM